MGGYSLIRKTRGAVGRVDRAFRCPGVQGGGRGTLTFVCYPNYFFCSNF